MASRAKHWAPTQDARERNLALQCALYVVALGLLSFAAQHHSYVGVVVLTVVLAASGIGVHMTLAAFDRTADARRGQRIAVLLGALEAGVVIVLVRRLQVFDLPGFLGLSLVLFAGGQLAVEVRLSKVLQRPIAAFFGVNLLAVVVGGVLLGKGGWVALAAPAVLLFPTVSLATEDLLDAAAGEAHTARAGRPWSPRAWRIVAGVAAAALVVGMALVVPVGGYAFALVMGALAVGVLAMIAANTDVYVFFVVIAVSLIWSQLPRGAPAPARFGGGHEVVAFGDSYMSGEGASRYLDGTNTNRAATRDECRRSPNSYPVRVARAMHLELDDFACSGAVVANILPSPADVPEPSKNHGQYIGENELQGVRPPPARRLTQLELFDGKHRDPSDVELVLVMVGGNDAGFADVAQTCIAPGDCSGRGQPRLDRLGTVGATLGPLYDELKRRFGDRVVVVPYPVPIRDQRCWIFNSTMTDSEHRFVSGFAQQLDTVIRAEAAGHHLRYASDMEGAFRVRKERICDRANPDVNYVALNPIQGRISPRDWVHNSMHPKDRGQIVMGDVLSQWLAAAHPPEDPATVPAPVLRLGEELNANPSRPRIEVSDLCAATPPGQPCQPPDATWTYQETRHSLRSHLVAIVAVLGGAWGLCLWGLRLRRHRDAAVRGRKAAPPRSSAP
ncbi:MAG TPA: GDSL-type esterase/lipase family protein [Acidimicrobiales bacterium]